MLRLATIVAVVVLIALFVVAGSAYSQAVGDPLVPTAISGLWGAPIFGAIGGVIYELIALEGNVEWPHKTVSADVPPDGFPHAKLPFLFDLGILARMIVGAMAAIAIYWVLPLEPGIKSLAISLIAGFSGTVVFRSLQDRLLVAVKTAQVETLKKGLVKLQSDSETARSSRAGVALLANPAAVIEDAELAKLHGEIEALLVVASR